MQVGQAVGRSVRRRDGAGGRAFPQLGQRKIASRLAVAVVSGDNVDASAAFAVATKRADAFARFLASTNRGAKDVEATVVDLCIHGIGETKHNSAILERQL